MPLPPRRAHGHHETHYGSSAALRDFVIGISDGLTVPFALSAGLSGAVNSNSIILIAGMAEVVAGTISMGLGGYLAGQTEIEHYEGEQKREEMEVKEIPHKEAEEVKEILAAYGISPAVQDQGGRGTGQGPLQVGGFHDAFRTGPGKTRPRRGLFQRPCASACPTPSAGSFPSPLISSGKHPVSLEYSAAHHRLVPIGLRFFQGPFHRAKPLEGRPDRDPDRHRRRRRRLRHRQVN